MDKFFLRLVLFFSIILFANSLTANPREQFSRNFWQPTYHGLRLNYCSLDGKSCGLAVANRYCKLMGYKRANHLVKANNVGLTQYIYQPIKCVGWQCNSFKTIRCLGLINHKPAEDYHYRLHHFVYPRYANYRVAWCYDGTHRCGKRAAYSFCRHMGYMGVRKYTIQKSVSATKALANEKLCFGDHCSGFSQIDCYR